MSGQMDGYYSPIEVLPRDEIRSLQERRLLETITVAYEKAPLIREMWDKAGVHPSDVKSLEDFSRLAPFTVKDDLRDYRSAHDDPFGGILCRPLEELVFIGSSSGTTGDPTLFANVGTDTIPFNDRSADNFSSDYLYYGLREMWAAGLRPGDSAVMIIPTMRGASYKPYEQLGVTSLFVDHYPSEMTRFVDLSLKYRPKYCVMLSTPLILALEELEENSHIDMRDVFSSYLAVVFGGEPLSQRLQALIKRWDVNIVNMCTAGDALSVIECVPDNGVHIWEDQVYAECLEVETGNPVGNSGIGELVVTSLTDHVDPLIRYRSEDLVEYTEERSECGRTHARIKILGRTGDLIRVNGQPIMPKDVWSAIETIPETKMGLFQIICPTTSLDTLRVRIGYSQCDDMDNLRHRLEGSIASVTGIDPVIELVPNDELLKLGPPHKIPRTAKS